MTVAFEFTTGNRLPVLGWVAMVCASGDNLTVRAVLGDGVERFSQGFFEGSWTGNYIEADPASSPLTLGSGVLARNAEEIVIIPPAHTMEKLFSLRHTNRIIFSNSLPLILAYSGESLDSGYRSYTLDLLSFMGGLDTAERQIPLKSGVDLRLHYYHCLRVDKDLVPDPVDRTPLPVVQTFEDYRDLWRDYVCLLVENAGAAERTYPFCPLSTLSRGFDSPAVAALVLAAGGIEGVTFTRGRSAFGAESDSGSVIGQSMGIQVAEVDRLDYLRRTDLPELPFLACGTGAEDVIFSSLGDMLRGKVLFTGFGGDTLWALDHKNPKASALFVLSYPAGASLQEYRIRVGFQHCPLPLLGFPQHLSVLRISQSDSMSPWLLGTSDYERPVARRLAEEAGAPRELIGRSKAAVAQPLDHCYGLASAVGPLTYRTFREETSEGVALMTKAAQRIVRTLVHFGDWPLIHVVNWVARRTLQRPIEVERRLVSRLSARFSDHESAFVWSVNRLQSTAEQAMLEDLRPGYFEDS